MAGEKREGEEEEEKENSTRAWREDNATPPKPTETVGDGGVALRLHLDQVAIAIIMGMVTRTVAL